VVTKSKIEISKGRVRLKRVKQISEGIFSTLFDITLFCLYLPICSFGKNPTSRDVYKTFSEAEDLLKDINYDTFRRSLEILHRYGLIETLKKWSNEPKITAAGKKRLESTLPQYQTSRFWDGKMYLINYDFAINENIIRDKFREYIKRLGALKLQDSLYLISNNPYIFINKFQKEYKFHGVILVSELDKKGFLGQDNLKEFIWKISKLEEVNNRYAEFIAKYKHQRKTSLIKISFDYYSILRDDPQLPFELLPKEYLGNEAYLLYQGLIKTTK